MIEENRLNDELKKFNVQELASDAAMNEVIKDIVKLSELLRNASAYWSFAKSAEREQIMRVIFSELSLSENTMQFKVKKGFAPFQSRLLVVGDPSAWISELQNYGEYLRISMQELGAIVK